MSVLIGKGRLKRFSKLEASEHAYVAREIKCQLERAHIEEEEPIESAENQSCLTQVLVD